MATRRGNGEGTVRQRAPHLWEAVVTFDGTRYRRTAATQAEARRQLAELRADHSAGELVRPSKITLAQHLEDWLAANAANWRPSTSAGYALEVRLHLTPALGTRRLQSLTAADLARQYARWRADGVGERTIGILHARLHRALRQAVLWGRIARNPADSIEPPRHTYRRPELWTPEQSATFVASLDGADWSSALFGLLVGGGLRIGEALALTWGEVDLDTGTARIERTRGFVQRRSYEGPTKTQAGQRTIALPGFAVTALRAWRKVQASERLRAGPAWSGADRVVTTDTGATPHASMAAYRLRKRAAALNLPPLRCHDLRHLSASLALSAGVPLVDVSRRLGHSNVAITASVYSHALRANDSHVANAIEQALTSATG